jgi:hypothetical protein
MNCILLLILLNTFHTSGELHKDSSTTSIPQSLRKEHEELHTILERASKLEGGTGKAAQDVAKLLYPHFEKEESFALPALGILPLLSKGWLPPDPENIIKMTERLRAELPQMIAEHKAITSALEKLTQEAAKENRAEYVRFAQKLRQHAQSEEEILYPAAILVGEHLKLMLKNKNEVNQTTDKK